MKRKNFYLPEALFSRLEDYCARYGVTQAEVVRMAIHLFLKSQEAKK